MNTVHPRDHFPTISNHPERIYFDNASMTQLPDSVSRCIQEYQTSLRVNAHRAAYSHASSVSRQIEVARETVADFIHANSPEEVIFTSGTSQGIHVLLWHWALLNLRSGDQIILGKNDHESVINPWIDLQKFLAQNGTQIHLSYFSHTVFGVPNIDEIEQLMTPQTRLVVLTHVHNVYGAAIDLSEIRKKIDPEVLVALDATQSIGQLDIDVQTLGIQFLFFSGHKMFADTGTGVLWIDKRLHNQLRGSAVDRGPMPHSLESGTLHIPGIMSLVSAIEWIQQIGKPYIQSHLVHLTQHLIGKLRAFESLEFLPGIAHCSCYEGYGIVSFRLENVSSDDVGFFLDEHAIYVRTGTHCIASDSVKDSIRVSMQVYNTEEEVERFVTVLQTIPQ